MALAVGITMLEVGPGSCTAPKPDSVTVLDAETELPIESKAATMFRVGDSTIRPGETPALSSESRGTVSFWPLMNTRPPKLKVEVTPCEASTRFSKPLGGL